MPAKALVIAIAFLLSSSILLAQVAIGEWRDHFPYNSTLDVVEGGGKAFAATEFGIFSYNLNDNSIERHTKINSLSDIGISKLAWSDALNSLVVGYGNGNVDLISSSASVNIPDIERSNILGDKGIYSIFLDGELAYLGCGFGIVVIDLFRQEIKDTYLIGPNGSHVQVNDLTFFNDSIYAATEEGLFCAWLQEPNLSNFNSWTKRTDVPHPNGPFNLVGSFQNKLYVNFRYDQQDQQDTVYFYEPGWQPLVQVYGRSNLNMDVGAGDILTVTHKNNIHVFDGNFAELWYIDQYQGQNSNPKQCIRGSFGNYWIADSRVGLVSFGQGDVLILPNGPKGSEAHRMDMVDGKLWVTTGALAGNWGNLFEKKGVYKYINGNWGFLDGSNEPELATGWNTYAGSVNDYIAVAVNPADPSQVFVGTWDDGIIEFRNGVFHQFYRPDNSSLQVCLDNAADEKVDVAGLAFDLNGNLWVTNSNVEEPISVRTPSGSWRSFDPGSILTGNTLLADIVVTESGLKWMVRPRGNGILVFNDNNTISNTTDDQYKVLNAFEGSGGLPTLDVYSLAVDLDGEVWVGTAKGIAVYYNPDAVFSGGNYDAQQILIEQDGNIQILLETEVVSTIAIDGANRKWFGTQGAGVFLMSEDGSDQIHHFTVDNSPLLSNGINDIAIDNITGEVFFGTEKGIVSYKSDATGGELEASCAKVYPNPVRETYTGPIAITGLVRDSDVKITDISGNLVYRTRSEGGQALWYGNNMDGQRVSTGVYLAFSTDREGENSCVTKILFIK